MSALARIQTVTIPSGQSLSNALDCADFHPTGLFMPAAWTAAAITAQASADGVVWQDVYDRYGTEFSIVTAAGRCVSLAPSDLGPNRFLRFRSGTGATPVAQSAAAALAVQLKPYA